MAKHFKPPKENPVNTYKNTRVIALDIGNQVFSAQDITPREGQHMRTNGGYVLHISDLFYDGVERVYIVDRRDVEYLV